VSRGEKVILEIVEFTVVDDGAFAALNDRFQEDVAYQSPGLMRRTVARGDDGTWVDVRMWSDDSAVRMEGDAAVRSAYGASVNVTATRVFRPL
jgi:hypothetical protein